MNNQIILKNILIAGLVILAGLSSGISINSQETHPSLVAEGASLNKNAGGFNFTEGPASDPKGNIYFTDIPNNRIHKWSQDGTVLVFLENLSGANGLAFDGKGNLIACKHGSRSVTLIDPDGNEIILVDTYKGKRLNSPNDLWIDAKGGIYFTDPRYGNRDNLEQDGEHVYYLSPDRKKLNRVIDDMVRPNGVIGTADGITLYVADQGGRQTFKYNINHDGSLSDKKLFTAEGSDGLTLDEKGNLYITGIAVRIFSPEGKFLEHIVVPETPANICFGGKDGRTLFITARQSLYSIRMKVNAAKSES